MRWKLLPKARHASGNEALRQRTPKIAEGLLQFEKNLGLSPHLFACARPGNRLKPTSHLKRIDPP